MKTLLAKRWHHLSETEVTELLETDPDKGLADSEIERRREQFGINTISRKKSKSQLTLFLLQFHQPLVYILLGSGVVTSVLQEWVDSGVIFGVVLVNAVIGYTQEAKAVKAIETLANTMSSGTTVW